MICQIILLDYVSDSVDINYYGNMNPNILKTVTCDNNLENTEKDFLDIGFVQCIYFLWIWWCSSFCGFFHNVAYWKGMITHMLYAVVMSVGF